MSSPSGSKLTLSDIHPKPTSSTQPDDHTRREMAAFNTAQAQARLRNFEQNIALRKEYAGKIYRLVVGWLFALFVLLVASGVGNVFGVVSLSDRVIMTLITGTTINVLGIFVIVAKYIFRTK